MRVYLIRHGEARQANDDASRTLTAEGRRAVRRMAQAMARVGAHPAKILASPLPRAVQTAEIVAGALGYAGEIDTHPRLLPATPAILAEPILAAEDEDLALVGHEPLLSALAALLLDAPFPPLGKAQAVCLERGEAGPARHVWTVDAKTAEKRGA